jgi:hypothetical protein
MADYMDLSFPFFRLEIACPKELQKLFAKPDQQTRDENDQENEQAQQRYKGAQWSLHEQGVQDLEKISHRCPIQRPTSGFGPMKFRSPLSIRWDQVNVIMQ